MISDDTEHAELTAQALLHSGPDDPSAFQRCLAGKLRGWVLAAPPGADIATLKSCLKLIGWSPERSGVESAGNGAMMRAPILGVVLGDNEERLRQYIRASTRMTHSDLRAECAALCAAFAAFYSTRTPREHWSTDAALAPAFRAWPESDPVARNWMQVVREALTNDWMPDAFLAALNLPKGPTGFVQHTMPAVLFAWLRSPFDMNEILRTAIALGGDVDTVAAIAGGIAGAGLRQEELPTELLHSIRDMPRSIGHLRRVGDALDLAMRENQLGQKVALRWWLGLPRNLFLLVVVILHGFRRLVP